MALSERYRLVSTEIVIGEDNVQSVQFLWAYEILKDGVVQASNNHRGAYPRADDGTPLVDIAPPISEILTGLDSSLILQLDEVRNELAATMAQREAAKNDLQTAQTAIVNQQTEIDELKRQLQNQSQG